MSKDVNAKKAVILVNLGTPSAPTPKSVRRFLKQFLSDKRVVDLPSLIWKPLLYGIILPFRSRASAKNYQKIWTEHGSPLMNYSLSVSKNLQDKVDENVVVECAMRYGEPSIKNALKRLQNETVAELVVLPLYPQYSATTTATIADEVFKHLKTWRFVPRVKFINQYADHSFYIDAVANSILEHQKNTGKPDKLLLSFHGIPKRFFDAGDPYYCYCHKSARLIAEKVGLKEDEWQLVFQSRFGREPWLEPYCDVTLQQLAQDGCQRVDVVCPGFAVDCLETLEEIAITNKQLFLNAGGKEYFYIPALNDSENQIKLLHQLVEK